MNLLISRQTHLFPALDVKKNLNFVLTALLRQESACLETEISMVLCDDPFIRDLNRRHRGQDKATDVLSFPQDEPLLLGDIVISLETAARQSESIGWPLESEVSLLAVHGLLHLLGCEDETVQGAAYMRDRSLLVLTACGIEPPAHMAHPFFGEYE